MRDIDCRVIIQMNWRKNFTTNIASGNGECMTFLELNELHEYLRTNGKEAALPINMADKWLNTLGCNNFGSLEGQDECCSGAYTLLIYTILGESFTEFEPENTFSVYKYYHAALRKEIVERLTNCRISRYNIGNFSRQMTNFDRNGHFDILTAPVINFGSEFGASCNQKFQDCYQSTTVRAYQEVPMNVRKFFGSTTREALRQVKGVFGYESIVLSNIRVEDGILVIACPTIK